MSFPFLDEITSQIGEDCARLIAKATRRFLYPWSDLETELARDGKEGLSLIGYGSLLHPDSARRTIPDTPQTGHPPILAFGARRIFNYVMPDGLFRRRGEIPPVTERAALNMFWTGSADDFFNGRLIIVPPADLPALREREQGYHLDPVAYVPWADTEASPQIAYVLRADKTPWKGRVVVSSDILPNLPYLNMCREGARLVDDRFEQTLLATTWLADDVTRLDDYIRSLGLARR